MRRTNYIIWLIIFNILVLSSTNTLVMPFLLMYLKESTQMSRFFVASFMSTVHHMNRFIILRKSVKRVKVNLHFQNTTTLRYAAL